MTQHLRLRIHVTEPWDFERANGTNELTGWTVDHADEENEEWEVTLDQSFEFREKQYSTILVGPRYVGEHLRRMFRSEERGVGKGGVSPCESRGATNIKK